MGYALYGNDLDEEHTPLEAGLGWIVKLDKGDFVGRDALVAQKERGCRRQLVGLHAAGSAASRGPATSVLEGERPVGRGDLAAP